MRRSFSTCRHKARARLSPHCSLMAQHMDSGAVGRACLGGRALSCDQLLRHAKGGMSKTRLILTFVACCDSGCTQWGTHSHPGTPTACRRRRSRTWLPRGIPRSRTAPASATSADSCVGVKKYHTLQTPELFVCLGKKKKKKWASAHGFAGHTVVRARLVRQPHALRFGSMCSGFAARMARHVPVVVWP